MSAAPTGPTPSEIAQFELRDATWKRQQVDGFVIRVRPTDCKYLPVQRLGMGKTMRRWIDAVRWYETEKPYFTCCGGDAWLRPETRGAKCGCSRCEE